MYVARLQWLREDFLKYLAEWEKEVYAMKGLKRKEQQKHCLSRETLQGIENHWLVYIIIIFKNWYNSYT